MEEKKFKNIRNLKLTDLRVFISHDSKIDDNSELLNQNKIIEYPFERYIVRVEVSPSNEFIGIVEIEINKDFRSFQQKNLLKSSHDVEELYLED